MLTLLCFVNLWLSLSAWQPDVAAWCIQTWTRSTENSCVYRQVSMQMYANVLYIYWCTKCTCTCAWQNFIYIFCMHEQINQHINIGVDMLMYRYITHMISMCMPNYIYSKSICIHIYTHATHTYMHEQSWTYLYAFIGTTQYVYIYIYCVSIYIHSIYLNVWLCDWARAHVLTYVILVPYWIRCVLYSFLVCSILSWVSPWCRSAGLLLDLQPEDPYEVLGLSQGAKIDSNLVGLVPPNCVHDLTHHTLICASFPFVGCFRQTATCWERNDSV